MAKYQIVHEFIDKDDDKRYKPGEIVEVKEEKADRLIKAGVVKAGDSSGPKGNKTTDKRSNKSSGSKATRKD